VGERGKVGAEYSLKWRERVGGQTSGEVRPRTKEESLMREIGIKDL